jgi:itaconate CoA-transferase
MHPLKGLLVLSLEQAVAAPLCSMRLADAGARVIKIERTEGDFARGYDCAAAGQSSYFVWLNRGKQSLVADIKKQADTALLHTILARADVFIQNLAPGAAARSGFGAPELRARYPRLITLDISGYAEQSPYAEMKAYDLLIQAESGLSSVTGNQAGSGRVGISMCDIATGLTGYSALLEALIARGIDGMGRDLKISLFDVVAEWMNVPLLHYESTGNQPARLGLAHPSICPYGGFVLADSSLVLIAIQNEREWERFCTDVLCMPDLAHLRGFETNNARVANRTTVDAKIGKLFAGLQPADAINRLRTAGTAYGFVNDLAGLAAHPALRRIVVDTPGGKIGLAAPPVVGGGAHPFGRVPALGEHSAAIRAEFMD